MHKNNTINNDTTKSPTTVWRTPYEAHPIFAISLGKLISRHWFVTNSRTTLNIFHGHLISRFWSRHFCTCFRINWQCFRVPEPLFIRTPPRPSPVAVRGSVCYFHPVKVRCVLGHYKQRDLGRPSMSIAFTMLALGNGSFEWRGFLEFPWHHRRVVSDCCYYCCKTCIFP